MSIVQKITRAWHSATYHYRLFGRDGLRFIAQKRNPKNTLIHITPKGYLHPISLRNNTTDLPMFYHIFAAMDYALSLPAAPEIIIDCGAHVGLGAIYFANQYPGATIISVEAERSNYEMLVKNTASYPQIHALHGAIWNDTVPMKLVDANLGNWGYMTEPLATGEPGSIPAITIPELLEKFGLKKIDLCKINIEGAEAALFEKNYTGWLSKTNYLLIELHDHMRKGCSRSLFKALEPFDYEVSTRGFSLLIKLNHQAG